MGDAKRHAAPQTATADLLMESMEKKGQVTKLAFKISLELLILLLLPIYNHFHNPATSRVPIHTRLIRSSLAFSIYLGCDFIGCFGD